MWEEVEKKAVAEKGSKRVSTINFLILSKGHMRYS
jgi:hypothetical protein